MNPLIDLAKSLYNDVKNLKYVKMGEEAKKIIKSRFGRVGEENLIQSDKCPCTFLIKDTKWTLFYNSSIKCFHLYHVDFDFNFSKGDNRFNIRPIFNLTDFGLALEETEKSFPLDK